MHGVILAAGLGRRMQPLPPGVAHKGLLELGGSTILGRLVAGLREIGVGTITVVTGHAADAVRAHLAGAHPGVAFRWVHNPRYAETNNIVSLALALDAFEGDEDVILSECDLVLDPSALGPLAGDAVGNVALVDRYRAGMDGTVVSAEDGYVTEVLPPARQGPGFVYADKFKTLNVYRFEGEFCRRRLRPLLHWYAETIDAGSYYEYVIAMLVRLSDHRVAAALVPPESWVEVDDHNDLAAARFRFEPERRAEILDRALGGHWSLAVEDFSFMRNEHFPTAAMLAMLREALPSLVGNYGSSQAVLDEKLAWFLRCDPARLLTLHGASQAFPILRQLLGERRVAIPTPTFGEYPRMFPTAALYPDALLDGDGNGALYAAAAADCDVLVVVSPNNPTGTTVPTAELHALAASHPETLIVVDESFGEFSDEPPLVQALEAEPLANVVVLVSLSKTLGAPGLRIGYLYTCDPQLRASVAARVPVWNMGAPAEFFIELLLKFRPELAESIRLTRADRDALAASLSELPGVDAVFAGGGNFVLVRLYGDAAHAAELRRMLLADEAIEVKDASAKFPDGRGWLRLAARPPQVSERLLRALTRQPVPS